MCEFCGGEIKVAIFRNERYCSGNCKKGLEQREARQEAAEE